MRILICGGRNYGRSMDEEGFQVPNVKHAYIMSKAFGDIRTDFGAENVTIIHGAAPGADTMADIMAQRYGMKVEAYHAAWGKYGKRAGPMRNQRMLVEGKPDLVLAFTGGTGTANMVAQAEKAGVLVIKIEGG